MKIAIHGKMCYGKTTLANIIKEFLPEQLSEADIEKTVIEIKKLIKIYTQYISECDEEENVSQNGKVKPSEKMGYLTSVKKARKDLEDIFKLEVEDTKES